MCSTFEMLFSMAVLHIHGMPSISSSYSESLPWFCKCAERSKSGELELVCGRPRMNALFNNAAPSRGTPSKSSSSFSSAEVAAGSASSILAVSYSMKISLIIRLLQMHRAIAYLPLSHPRRYSWSFAESFSNKSSIPPTPGILVIRAPWTLRPSNDFRHFYMRHADGGTCPPYTFPCLNCFRKTTQECYNWSKLQVISLDREKRTELTMF